MVAPWKKEEVKTLSKKVGSAKVVGLVDIANIPSKQMQQMRKKLKDDAEIKITRNSIIKHTLEKAKIEGMNDFVDGPTGIVFTDLNPFKLEKILSQNKVNVPAKPGTTSPKDIIIPKGDTPFAPGPIIGELQGAGIKAKIEGGKIVVTEDSQVASEGEKISEEVAAALSRLGITPIEIGLNLRSAYEDGTIYTPDVLQIDEGKTLSDLTTCHISALNLALNANIINETTLPVFLRDAHTKAVNLAYNTEILNKETIEYFISKANTQAAALSSKMPDLPREEGEEKKEAEEKQAPKQEEKEPKPEEEAAEEEEKLSEPKKPKEEKEQADETKPEAEEPKKEEPKKPEKEEKEKSEKPAETKETPTEKSDKTNKTPKEASKKPAEA